MKRRTARENAFLAAFAESFRPGSMTEIIEDSRTAGEHAVDPFGESLLVCYAANREKADAMIEPNLRNWKLGRLPRVSLVALEMAVSEMFFGPSSDMDSVIINETVEIVKKFGDADDYQFVNGLLGTLARGRSGDAEKAEGSDEGASVPESAGTDPEKPAVPGAEHADKSGASAEAADPEPAVKAAEAPEVSGAEDVAASLPKQADGPC